MLLFCLGDGIQVPLLLTFIINSLKSDLHCLKIIFEIIIESGEYYPSFHIIGDLCQHMSQ